MFNWKNQLLQVTEVGEQSNLGDLLLILDDSAIIEREILPTVKEFFQDELQLGRLADCYCVISLREISKNTNFRIRSALEILSGLGDLTDLIEMAIVNVGIVSEIGHVVGSITLWNDGSYQIDYVHVIDNDDLQFTENAKKIVEKAVANVLGDFTEEVAS
ncbi:hypothetical protein [Candidatus Borrarchaeum sp.]|uniref:hypothetical protein n=1 Tax=Candidatus Borrarchaeum sp. TaxID=2846742 RepID=UPI00257B41B5|nr:hypothetical protein [Candidatus Borrarchaeum sp.]